MSLSDKIYDCIEGLVEYKTFRHCWGNFGLNQNPCQNDLNAYVSCMTQHQHQRPQRYEVEWCATERDQYNECRAALRK